MKSLVKRSFSRVAKTYQQSADIQRVVAEKLAGMVGRDFYENVLELGIGTGMFTSFLMDRIRFSRYFALDISMDFLKVSKEKFEGVTMVNGDIERLPIKVGDIDLVVASSVLQWLEKPEVSIPNVLDSLKKDSEVYFSIFVKGTFKEMEYVSSLTGFGSVYSLKSENFYRKIFESQNDFLWEFMVEDYVNYYPTPIAFLKKHKNTGATYTGSSRFCSKKALRNFCKIYEELFSCGDQGIPVTYRILYAKGLKLS